MGLRVYEGSVAIVTGAASGIGRELAEQLALAGSDVVLADLQADLVEEVADGIVRRGGRAEAVRVDVREFAQVQSLVEKAHGDRQRIDFMFNNAGIAIGGNIVEHTAEDWDRIVDVNVKGVAYGVQAVLGTMMDQGFGHIVNTASISGLLAVPGTVAYSTTKHAVIGMSKSLRGELVRYGIRVTAICPGAIDTPLLVGGKYGRFVGVSASVGRHVLTSFGPMPPEELVRKALQGIKKNKALVILPWQYKCMWQLLKRMPISWEIGIIRKHVAKRRLEAERICPDETVSAETVDTDSG